MTYTKSVSFETKLRDIPVRIEYDHTQIDRHDYHQEVTGLYIVTKNNEMLDISDMLYYDGVTKEVFKEIEKYMDVKLELEFTKDVD